MLVPDW